MIQAAGSKHWKAVGLNKRNKVGEQFAVDPGKRGAGSGFLRRRGEGARNHEPVEVLGGGQWKGNSTPTGGKVWSFLFLKNNSLFYIGVLLACCDSWGRKELDTTERLIWSDCWLTMFWWFQVDSKGDLPYMYPFSSKLPSHPGCHITLSRVPCALHRLDLVGYPF